MIFLGFDPFLFPNMYHISVTYKFVEMSTVDFLKNPKSTFSQPLIFPLSDDLFMFVID